MKKKLASKLCRFSTCVTIFLHYGMFLTAFKSLMFMVFLAVSSWLAVVYVVVTSSRKVGTFAGTLGAEVNVGVWTAAVLSVLLTFATDESAPAMVTGRTGLYF